MLINPLYSPRMALWCITNQKVKQTLDVAVLSV